MSRKMRSRRVKFLLLKVLWDKTNQAVMKDLMEVRQIKSI
jgi:hypothetical protein